jgi:general secretion pathway protein G
LIHDTLNWPIPENMNNSMEKLPMDCENNSNDFPTSNNLNRNDYSRGFTLIEIMIVIAIIGTLSAIALPSYLRYKNNARIAAACADIRIIEKQISNFVIDNDQLPNSLNQLTTISIVIDPWGNPYQYLRINGGPPAVAGQARRDQFLVPVNTDYDLYSMGADGRTQTPFTAAAARDDIVRANDGEYVGLASDY